MIGVGRMSFLSSLVSLVTLINKIAQNRKIQTTALKQNVLDISEGGVGHQRALVTLSVRIA